MPVPVDRAADAWNSLARSCLRSGRDGSLVVLERPGDRGAAAVWPVSQVLGAACALAELTGDYDDVERLVVGLRPYADGDGFRPTPGQRRRYYDDNAWLGLCFTQLHLQTGEVRWLRRARRVFGFVRAGADADGGVRWVEGRRARHTCSTGPAAQLAMRLHLADGGRETLSFATAALDWLDRSLRVRGGLYADHVDADGRVDATLWSYNQGSPAGAHALVHRATGDRSHLEHANAIAAASLQRFGAERAWRHPPVFNAVWLRNLLSIDAGGTGVPGLRDALDHYLDRAWGPGRDGDGLFTAGGIGTYDGRPAIDAGGIVQLLAMRAWPRQRRDRIC